ncbi:signal recognition particle subunit SRP68-like [Clytia hemisphaerica]
MEVEDAPSAAPETTSPATIQEEKQSYSIELLPLIKEAQQHHGLRHGDYQRYRQYCQRRLKRIRNSLNFKLGTRHGFKGKKITQETVNDPRFLHIILMEAERCWSHAMELKLYANTEPRKKFHMVRKLSKASKYADDLKDLCNIDQVDARTKLEVQAYSYWMTANMKFEVQNWQTAIDLYTQSRSIYEKLSSAFMDEDTKMLYLQRVEEISPNIRYCAYNLGQGGLDINELMKMRSKATGQDMLAAKIDSSKKRNETTLNNLQFMKTHLSYLRQTLMIDRNLEMIENMKLKLPNILGRPAKQQVKGKITKPEDLIRLYDSIIQCLTETSQLSGLEDDEAMERELNAQITSYKAFRCFYIAQSYQAAKKWLESIFLYDRVLKYVEDSCKALNATQNALLKPLERKLEDVAEQAKGHKYAAHATSILETSEVESGIKNVQLNDKVLLDRLETYQELHTIPKNASLVQFPPQPQPVPCKPLFFDLALNHIDLPDLDHRIEKKQEAGGISGFVKGWLWGGSK